MPSDGHWLRRLAGVALVGAGILFCIAGHANGPRFFPDDPLQVDRDTDLDASGVTEIEDGNLWDFVSNTFFTPGDDSDIPAVNVNTIDEVPDSSWFVNRIGKRPVTVDEIVRGPDLVPALSVDGWPIVQGKDTGLQPGFRIADPTGHLYQLEFDPPSNPEMATGAEIIGTAFYHAMGYFVVPVYLVEVDRDSLTISPKATIKDITGKRRRLEKPDVDEVFRRAARQPNGKYRALAGRFADGVQVGSFRYAGTRPDDPNDVFPHEHRRELRANRVFAAWLNHDDSRGLNSLDMLEERDGRKFIRHYMFDFGSIMGSGTAFAQSHRAGNEYILDWMEGVKTGATLGIYLRPWLRVKYPDVPPAVGRFEGDYFDPEGWKPEYPNPAFRNMRPDDAFWGARIVAKFSDDIIRAVAAKAKYSDPRATDFIVGTLIKRRDKVLRTWLNQVNPASDFELGPDGTLTFGNAAVETGAATPPSAYTLRWSRYDNTLDRHVPVGDEVRVTGPRASTPREALSGTDYVSLEIRAEHPQQPRWARPTMVYFRRENGGWKAVGIERAISTKPESIRLRQASPVVVPAKQKKDDR
ncbi:MAG: hypothetical protein HYX76_00180 [Acidobacteria bacterium]|nr:hypothetical protein [Acidobacteriota bacterium]